MTPNVFYEVVEELEVMYGTQPTWDERKVTVIVNRVIEEVVKLRRYREENYSYEMIDNDLMRYKSHIYNVSEYDFAKLGAPHETSRTENSTSRSWIDRNKLFSGIIPLTHRR